MKKYFSFLLLAIVTYFSSSSYAVETEFYRYKVQENDTLGNILGRWGACPLWGSNGSVKKTHELNKDLMERFNKNLLVDTTIKLPPTKHPKRILPASGSLIALPQDLPELCNAQDALDVVLQDSTVETKIVETKIYVEPPRFKKEQLSNALLVISISDTNMINETSSVPIEEGTALLVVTKNGDELRHNTLRVELPSGEQGEIPRKDVALFSSEGYVRVYQRQSRDTWNGFIEPVGFVANKPLRLGGGLSLSKTLWPDGLLGSKETLLAINLNILQTIKANKLLLKPLTSNLSADLYFRLGDNGYFMMGPSVGYVFGKNSPYLQKSFPSIAIKGRIMFDKNIGLYGELSSYGIQPMHSMYAIGGLSFTY